MAKLGGGFLKFMCHEHFRGYAYRGESRREGGEHDTGHLRRFFREYLWKHRWMLLTTILVIGLNNSGPYIIAALNRVTVDRILVVTDEEGRPMTPPPKTRYQEGTAPQYRSPGRTPPRESMGRRMARGVRLNGRPAEAGRALLLLAGLYVLSQLFFNFLSRRADYLLVDFSMQVLGTLRENMHRKAMALSLGYQQKVTPGRLLSRVVSDTGAVRAEISGLVELTANVVFKVGIGVVILLVSEWRVLLVLLAIFPAFLWIRRHFEPSMRKMQREQRFTNSALYGLISQKMDAIKAIQSYGQQEREYLAFHRLSSTYNRDAIRVQWKYKVMDISTWFSLHLANCAVFLAGGYMVATGRMSLGKLVFLQTLTQIFFQPASEFTQLSFVLQRLQVALGRCFRILDELPEIQDAPDAVEMPRPLTRGIHIRDLTFAYDEKEAKQKGDEPLYALSHVNLDVPAGEWLCVMGASGAGKTTLLHLLARLYPPTSGTIDYDGVPLEKVSLESLHRNVGVVPQEAQIFSGTVRDNIAYGFPQASNHQILEAAKAAQLHEVIMEMPVQYETLIGEKGQSLSGGQRQRLSMARALLCQPGILLLDDCTSALDANTERKIQETLMTQMGGRTAVIVSQRVSMAIRCQHIAVLERGRVVEFGTHKELLERGGFYATLFREQTR
ncbi:MAG: ABC transporter ATP-binding protein [Oligosphaeraceae bacterium]